MTLNSHSSPRALPAAYNWLTYCGMKCDRKGVPSCLRFLTRHLSVFGRGRSVWNFSLLSLKSGAPSILRRKNGSSLPNSSLTSNSYCFPGVFSQVCVGVYDEFCYKFTNSPSKFKTAINKSPQEACVWSRIRLLPALICNYLWLHMIKATNFSCLFQGECLYLHKIKIYENRSDYNRRYCRFHQDGC